MTNKLSKMLDEVKKENPAAYGLFLHDLTHYIDVETLELMVAHAKGEKATESVNITKETVSVSDATTADEKLAALVAESEKFTEDLRSGKIDIPFDKLSEVTIAIHIRGEE